MHSSLALLQHQKPHSFFCRIPVVSENRRSSWGGGLCTPCTLPLDLPLLLSILVTSCKQMILIPNLVSINCIIVAININYCNHPNLLLCFMQPLECFSDMNAIIVVWCFYTKLAVLRDSTPVVLSVNHFTCEMQGYCLASLVTR